MKQNKLRDSVILDLHTKIAKARRSAKPNTKEKWAFLASLLLRRAEQALTQEQLAKRSGLQQSHIARIESGLANPTLDTLIKLSEALNCHLVLRYKNGKNINYR